LDKDNKKNKDRDKIERKTVAFDTSVPLQAKLYEIAESKGKGKFSEYIRTLMIADMLLNGALADLSIVKDEKKIYDLKDFEIEL